MAKNFSTEDTVADLVLRKDFTVPVFVSETSRIYNAVMNPRAQANKQTVIASIETNVFWVATGGSVESPLTPSVQKDPTTGKYVWDGKTPDVSIALTEDSTLCLCGQFPQGVRFTLIVLGDLVNETNRKLTFESHLFKDSAGSPIGSLTIDYAASEVFSFIAVGPKLLQLPVWEREGIGHSGYSVNIVSDYWDGIANTAPSSGIKVPTAKTYTNAKPFPTKGLIRQIQTDSVADSKFRLGAIAENGNLLRQSGPFKVVTTGNNWQTIQPPFLINQGESLGLTVVDGEFYSDDRTEVLGFVGGAGQMDIINVPAASHPPRFSSMASMFVARPLADTALIGFNAGTGVSVSGTNEVNLVNVTRVVERPDWLSIHTDSEPSIILAPGIYRMNFPLGLLTTTTAAEATVMMDGNWKNHARGVDVAIDKRFKVRSTVNGTFNVFKGVVAAKEPITISPRLVAQVKSVQLNSADTFIDIECLGLF